MSDEKKDDTPELVEIAIDAIRKYFKPRGIIVFIRKDCVELLEELS